MSFTTRAGASVDVVTTGSPAYPYRWECAADPEHRNLGGLALPITRDNAKAHADECQAGGAL